MKAIRKRRAWRELKYSGCRGWRRLAREGNVKDSCEKKFKRKQLIFRRIPKCHGKAEAGIGGSFAICCTSSVRCVLTPEGSQQW